VKIRRLGSGSVVYGALPEGCRLCQQGLKTVVFLTGKCPARCFYCPLSSERRNRDVVFVNERLVDQSELRTALVVEVLRSASLGVSFTGGEPLLKHRLVADLTALLKDRFTRRFHVHLYTSGMPLTPKIIEELADSGLDELRVHASLSKLEESLRKIRSASGGFRVGLEYPSLPGAYEQLIKLLDIAEKYELDFIVLNELEFTETNASSLLLRGFTMREDYRAAQGSSEVALRVIEEAERRGVAFSVHFCPVRVKDSFQTVLRTYRFSTLTALPYQLVTDEGTSLELMYTSSREESGILELYPEGRAPIFYDEVVAEGFIVERNLALGGLPLEETPLKGKLQTGR
jgi:Uncharacterized conserved protein related to pyruvate formate-lyase activating enzyme